MSDVFFSIIIPIYNVENYLHQCVDSVLAQTFRDFEVILVDDGSPDRCPQICDEYARLDTRVQVIHKANGGLSDARNHGITAATGNYLMFLDSDDYWNDAHALQQIHDELIQRDCAADVILFQAVLFYPDGSLQPDNWIYPAHFNSLLSIDALHCMITHGIFPGSAWVMAIRRQFLLEHDLYFKVGLQSEDIDWLLRLANRLPQYQYTDQAFYMYRKGRSGSITSTINCTYIEQFSELLAEFMNFEYSDSEVQFYLLSYVAYQFTILMGKVMNLSDKKKRNELYQRLRSMKELLIYDLHPKVRQVNRITKLCGFRITCTLLGWYLKFRKR